MNQLEQTLEWFKQAIPEPTDEQKCIQIGCHLEEVAEMTHEIYDSYETQLIEGLAEEYKKAYECNVNKLESVDRIALLDSLSDQIVTAIGVAHMFGFDIIGALEEVNRSNFSKFEDGKPVFNEHGKITKGKNYTPPNLESFI